MFVFIGIIYSVLEDLMLNQPPPSNEVIPSNSRTCNVHEKEVLACYAEVLV